ncbi:toll/interleukin-1 receptor domain-containing protein [Oscillatoria sp. FACHB-1407]|uniref:toll/interleukin-1 receptor domain-containing protein n=1 Tax=Oscillatoria sp. FACHB-1407 TaxID=2692847 RepID=UPI0016822FF5|nr:toll/interleukin-1 receptor domain-containing protein [Oscillatoria sp. FACHB-1407]MBD2465713.1 toll/interleukin-1 receptor domain-containing protein [Oscillatoria sp. FACHB-1407]
MVDVFISYSRRDKAFVQSLHQALQANNRDTWVDWQDIPLGTAWWNEIQSGIEASDTFIFVISPDSLASKVCNQEIDHAVLYRKRLMPIVRRDDFDSALLHPSLGEHNWLFFRERDDFNQAFQSLIEALDTDLNHVRMHTRLLIRAIEWENNGRNDSFLLRGSDLTKAEQWLKDSEEKHPAPAEQHKNYISKSRQAENASNRAKRLVGMGAAAMVIMFAIAAIFAQQRIQSAEAKVENLTSERDRIAEEADRNLSEIREEQRIAEAKVDEADRNLAIATQRLTDANRRVKLAEAQTTQAGVAREQAQLAAQQAQVQQQRAQQQAAAAQRQQAEARAEAGRVRIATGLEQRGADLLRRTSTQFGIVN